MKIFNRNKEFKSTIELDEDDLKDAKLSSADFSDEQIRKRAFVNILGARLAMKTLFSQKIEANNLYSLYTIQNVLRELDLADIYFQGIKIDVRLVFNRAEIFVPKTHFEYDLLPDVYFVLELQKDFSSAEFLGFFEPKDLNKQNANKDFYFYDYENLNAPEGVKDFLNNHVVQRDFEISEENFEKAEELFLSLVDKEISAQDKLFLLQQLANSVNLREKAVEFENFEIISNQIAKSGDLLEDQVLEIVGAQKIFNEDELEYQKSDELSELDLDDLELGELEILEESEPDKDESGGVISAAVAGGIAGGIAGSIVGGIAGASTSDVISDAVFALANGANIEISPEINFGESSEDEDEELEILEAEDEDDEFLEELAEDSEKNESDDEFDIDDLTSSDEDEIVEYEEDSDEESEEDSEEVSDEFELEEEADDENDLEGLVEASDNPDSEEDEIHDLSEFENVEDIEEIGEFEGELLEELPEIESSEFENIEEVEEKNVEIAEEDLDLKVLDEDLIEEETEEVEEDEEASENLEEEDDDEEILEEDDEDEDEDIGQEGENTNEFISQVDEILNDDLLTDVNLDDAKELLEIPEVQEEIESMEDESAEESVQQEPLNYSDLGFLDNQTGTDSEKSDEDMLQMLFKNEKIVEDDELKFEEKAPKVSFGNDKNKRVLIAASVAGIVVVSVLAGSVLKHKTPDAAALNPSTPPIEAVSENPMSGNIGDLTSEEAQDGIQADFQNDGLPENAGSSSQATGGTQPGRDMGKAVSDSFLSEPVNTSISKIGWEVPEDLAYNDNFRKYLQMVGRNLKLNLQNNLLLSSEMAYSNKVVLDLKIGKGGDLQSSSIVTSSGSKQIDNIVLQSVKETLKYLKVPSDEISGGSFEATLIINF